MPLHPEHAEARSFVDRGVEAGGKGEAEDVSGLDGVDDAVVPQSRGGVPRVTLRFVVVADRLLEGFGLLGRPLVGVAVDGARTLAACSPPITEIRLLGQLNRKRGE